MRPEDELIKSLGIVTSGKASLLEKGKNWAELLPFPHLLGSLYKVSKVLKRLCVRSQKEAFLTSHLSC